MENGKVTVIGAGFVGSTTAFSLMQPDLLLIVYVDLFISIFLAVILLFVGRLKVAK